MSGPGAREFIKSGRRTVLIGLRVFVISTAFPVLASIVPAANLPKWVGWLDVSLAAILVGVAFLMGRGERISITGETALAIVRAYRLLPIVPVALLALFFSVGDRLNWSVLVIGFAWRFSLLAYLLPEGIVALRGAKLNILSKRHLPVFAPEVDERGKICTWRRELEVQRMSAQEDIPVVGIASRQR